MEFRCVVVDDESPARSRLKRWLDKVEFLNCVGEAANVDEAVKVIDELQPDLCFLDVRMPGGTGFDVLDRCEHEPQVIFTTAYDQYAVQAFEVRSIDYLLKPFSRSRFAEAIERARETLERPEADPAGLKGLLDELKNSLATPDAAGSLDRIPGKRGSRIVLLDPKELLWFEAEETLVFATTLDGRFLVERTLTDLENSLGDSYFRSHRRYLVNLSQIAEIQPREAGTYTILIRGGSGLEIPLSRRQARKLRELIPW